MLQMMVGTGTAKWGIPCRRVFITSNGWPTTVEAIPARKPAITSMRGFGRVLSVMVKEKRNCVGARECFSTKNAKVDVIQFRDVTCIFEAALNQSDEV